jgi:hypothetical protein
VQALTAGDVLMVTRLARLARSPRDLLNTLAAITDQGAEFTSFGDAWADTTTPHSRLLQKHGQDIRYPSAEITGSYPVRTNSKSHNCCAETGKRV